MNSKVTLVICDGMGLSPNLLGNAVANAPTPTFDYLLQNYPSFRLLAAGPEVGLDIGEPGNSEVGHLTIGTGQVMPQAFQIINSAIKSEQYKSNKVFLQAFERAKRNDAVLHLVGLLSPGGVHGHIDHLIALLQLAKQKGVQRVAVHAITDGRDSPPKVAFNEYKKIMPLLASFPYGVLATIGGRFYAMDRDNNWERTDVYYWAMRGNAHFGSDSVEAAINAAYNRGEDDETMQPTVITNADKQPLAPIKEGDVVLFTNYRPDRIRQLVTRIIMLPFPITSVMMTDYFLADKPASTQGTTIFNAFPLPKPAVSLAKILADRRKSQLHIAETEKYAHITYFFDGHQEEREAREEWILIPSAKVKSFDEAPTMSAEAITSAYITARQYHPADFTVINFANMDMVGHTGNYEATLKAVTFVDGQIKRLVDAMANSPDWLIITADHGNAEQMIDPITGKIDKEHTTNPVPFILVNNEVKEARQMDKNQLAVFSQAGMLADVAPTILDIMEIDQPDQMGGTSLLTYLG